MPSAHGQDSQPSSPPRLDRLSALPPKILTTIFELVYEEQVAPHLPLNKATAPFFYAERYSFVELASARALKRFVRTMREFPERAHLVEDLWICVKEDDKADEEGKGDDLPTKKALVKLFRQLNELRGLSIIKASSIARLVLKPYVASRSLPHLEELRLQVPFETWDRPFTPSLYSSLSLYKDLSRLELQVERPFESFLPTSLRPIAPSSLPFARLKELCLTGSSLDPLAVGALLSCCSSLTSLALSDQSGEGDLPNLLSNLPNPSFLEYLSLLSTPRSSISQDLSAPLAPMTNLKQLSLVGPFDLSSSAFFDLLARFPLRDISFGWSPSFVPPHRVLALICEHATLCSVALADVKGSPQWTVTMQAAVQEAAAALGIVVVYGWQ
ncbi:hypothetical protein JCM10213_002851 [Rhodosporidiobolus nylandii]